MIERHHALSLLRRWEPGGDKLAAKSRELILLMIEQSRAPFSRQQFAPGHVTATSVVLDPDGRRFLLVHHRRLGRWLLPGGHLEPADATLVAAARREAEEETGALIRRGLGLVGVDVHGIPPRKSEPFHLHHDLIFGFHARSLECRVSAESRGVVWAAPGDFRRYQLAEPIRRAVRRAMGF